VTQTRRPGVIIVYGRIAMRPYEPLERRRMTAWRATCGVMAALLCAVVQLSVCAAQPPRPPVPSDPLCAVCHPWQAEEIAGTAHPSAWSNEVFQKALASADDPDHCGACHAPSPILVTGISKPPAARDAARELGVVCESCHTDGADAQVGPLAESWSPYHAYVSTKGAHDDYRTCGVCHGPAEPEWDQVTTFLPSPAHREGKSCQACHMPRETRPVAYNTRHVEHDAASHAFRGTGDVDFLRQAAEATVQVEGGTAVARVTSRGVGHSLPGSAGPRVITRLVALDGDGKELASTETVASWDGEGEDSRILPGSDRTSTLRLPTGTTEARVTVTYYPSGVTEGTQFGEASAKG